MIRILTVYGDLLLAAMGQTLLLALCGLFFACIIGLIVGMMSVVKNKLCNFLAALFVDLIRGVPMIVLGTSFTLACRICSIPLSASAASC